MARDITEDIVEGRVPNKGPAPPSASAAAARSAAAAMQAATSAGSGSAGSGGPNAAERSATAVYKARGGEEGTELTAWPLLQDGDGGGEVRSLHVSRARGSTRGESWRPVTNTNPHHPHPSRSAWTKLLWLPPNGH